MRAILSYHSIDDSESMVSVSPLAFRHHIGWLVNKGVRFVPVDEIMTVAPGTDAVALTFDDGLETFATEAWPVLRDVGAPVTVYVVTAMVNGFNDWDPDESGIPRQRLLDWDTLGRLSEEGVTIGSHTRNHADLAVVNAPALADEIEGSKCDIEAAIGVRATSFAYPYGFLGDEAVRRVRSCYDTACTTELRELDANDDARLLPRLDMYYFRKPGQIEAWGTTGFRRRLQVYALARKMRGRKHILTAAAMTRSG